MYDQIISEQLSDSTVLSSTPVPIQSSIPHNFIRTIIYSGACKHVCQNIMNIV